MAHPFIEHLVEDHEEQRRLGQQLREATDPAQREELRQKFQEALIPHIEGEEASIFKHMQSVGGKPKEEALKAIQEHHVGRVVLRELMDLTADSEIFRAKAYVLDEVNNHHMDEEEQTHFPMLVRLTSQEELDQLFEAYEAAEKEAKSD